MHECLVGTVGHLFVRLQFHRRAPPPLPWSSILQLFVSALFLP